MQGKISNDLHAHLLPWLTEKWIIDAPDAAAKALQNLATHEAVLLLKPLKAEQVIACLNGMEALKAAAILRRFPARQGAYILSRLNLPQAAAVYEAFSIPQQEKIKTLLSAHLLRAFTQAQAWKKGSAGAHMRREFVSFKTDVKVADIIEKLKNFPRKKLPAFCLILGKEGEIKGAIATAELLFCPLQAQAGSIMHPVTSVLADKPITDAYAVLKQGQPIVPVVDSAQIVLGVLSWEEVYQGKPVKKRFGWF